MIVASFYGLTSAAAFSIGMTAAAFAVNFAVSMIVTRIFADNPEQQQDMGVRQQVPPSAVNAVPIVYGNAYMGGTFVDAVLSTDQKTMYYVLAISSISPNGQFTFDTTDMYYGDRKIIFDGPNPTQVVSLTDEAGNVDTKINGNLFINLYRSNDAGTITPLNGAAAPSTVMGGSDIAAGQRWTGTRQMNGLGFAIVKLIYNRDAGTTQLSPITFKVSHTLNGTGVAKPGDVWYDYITSRVYGGAVGWLPNGTFDPSFVDSASRTALNAYSDELITFENSSGVPSTQARYRINGVLDAGDSVLSNIDRIMSACDSWMTYNAALGQWSVVVNKAETASYAFTDNNIVGDIRVSATDITSSINQVEARFPFKENRDQANFINIKTPTILLYPNEPVNKYSITYDLVNDSVQAHYLANRLLEQAREDLIVSFNTTYFGIQVDAGNVVSVTNSNYGWNAKLFRVMKVNEASLADGSLGARLELSEYNAQVYDDQTIRQFTPVPNSGLPSVMYFSPLSAPIVTSTSPSSAIPNFSVQTYVPATGRVTSIELYYTTVAIPLDTDWTLLTSANSISTEPIASNTNYVFRNLVLPTGSDSTKVYYFSYTVSNEIATSSKSPISASFSWTPIAPVGPFVDISGFTSFSKASGVFTPATATLTAITNNVTSPTYSWTVTGATPASGSSSTITITPTSVATSVNVTLVVNGSNLTSSITRQITMAIIEQAINGASGLTFINAYRVQNQADPIPTFTATTTGSAIPSGWVSTAPSVAVGQVMWYIQGRFNSNASVTINGVSPNTTAWTGPIAASIFQDIRSDNWNGSNPPVAATVGTWGTNGYYIERNTGNIFANGFYSRGVVKINGSSASSLGSTAAADVNASGDADFGVVGFSDNSSGIGVVGYTSNASTGVGVQGTSTTNASYGVLAANNAGGTALYVSGKMQITNNTLVTNLNADLLDGIQGSGFWQSGGSTVSLNSVSSGSSTATFSTTTKPGSASTNTWVGIVINGTTYYIPAWT
jgi:hypothetical protein